MESKTKRERYYFEILKVSRLLSRRSRRLIEIAAALGVGLKTARRILHAAQAAGLPVKRVRDPGDKRAYFWKLRRRIS